MTILAVFPTHNRLEHARLRVVERRGGNVRIRRQVGALGTEGDGIADGRDHYGK